MAAEANFSRTPGGRVPSGGVGTEATTRRKLLNPPLEGAGDTTSPAPIKTHQGELALESGGKEEVSTGAQPGSTEGGETGVGRRGGLLGGSSKPLSASSALIQILIDDRIAMRVAKEAIENIIFKLHIEDRSGLAIALCELNHSLAGGVR